MLTIICCIKKIKIKFNLTLDQAEIIFKIFLDLKLWETKNETKNIFKGFLVAIKNIYLRTKGKGIFFIEISLKTSNKMKNNFIAFCYINLTNKNK